MKIRTGFVSNSSSSSFCIFGVFVPRERVSEIATDGDVNEVAQKKLDDAGFTSIKIVTGQDGGDYGVYVGRDFTSIGMDETRREFEGKIATAIKLLFPENTPECGIHEESWYDG